MDRRLFTKSQITSKNKWQNIRLDICLEWNTTGKRPRTLLFIIFINDLPEDSKDADIFLFADDAKMFKFIDKTEDSSKLQKSCNYLYNWTNKWLMKLNINKCKVLFIGRAGTLRLSTSMDLTLQRGSKNLNKWLV